jgi:hypothetical protein
MIESYYFPCLVSGLSGLGVLEKIMEGLFYKFILGIAIIILQYLR